MSSVFVTRESILNEFSNPKAQNAWIDLAQMWGEDKINYDWESCEKSLLLNTYGGYCGEVVDKLIKMWGYDIAMEFASDCLQYALTFAWNKLEKD